LVTEFGNVIGESLTLLAVLGHKSIYIQGLLDGDLVPVLERLGVSVVESIELEAENFGNLVDPVRLPDL